MALHAYAREYEVLVPYTRDFGAVMRHLESFLARPAVDRAVPAKPDLGLGEALARLLELRGSDARFGDALVVVTRGEYYGPSPRRVQPEDVRPALLASGLRFFLVLNPPAQNREGRRAVQGLLIFQSQVKDLPADTGGAVLDPTRAAELSNQKQAFRIDPQIIRSTVRGLYPMIRYVYQVELQLEAPLAREMKLAFDTPRGSPGTVSGMIYPRFLARSSTR